MSLCMVQLSTMQRGLGLNQVVRNGDILSNVWQKMKKNNNQLTTKF